MKRWSVLMKWTGCDNWFRAAARFATKEEAEEHGWNQWNCHPTMKQYRVEPMPDEEEAPFG